MSAIKQDRQNRNLLLKIRQKGKKYPSGYGKNTERLLAAVGIKFMCPELSWR